MILDKFVRIPFSPKAAYFYERIGFLFPRYVDKQGRRKIVQSSFIRVPVKDLPKSSGVILKIKCEDCGKIRKTKYADLNDKSSGFVRNGTTRCIKCSREYRSGINSPSFKFGLGHMFGIYRDSAKKRNLPFKLTLKQFNTIVRNRCSICKIVENQTASKVMGIDRVDSEKGYSLDNCVPCCKDCNIAKNDKTVKEFKDWLKRASKHFLK